MSATPCPACGRPIDIADINIPEGVALCRPCGKLRRLTDLAESAAPDPDLIDSPPRGCRWEDTGVEVVVTASTRSLAGAGFLVFFAAFWNSIVFVFICIAAAGLYTNLVGPLPAGLTAPMMNGGPMSLGTSIFLCIFLIPFILVGAGVGVAALLSLFGRHTITIRGPEGAVRTAIGPLGRTRRFDASDVRRVVVTSTDSENGRRRSGIRIDAADRAVTFGALLPDHRREWTAAVLQTLLAPGRPRRTLAARR